MQVNPRSAPPEVFWLSEASSLRIESSQYEELRVRDRALLLSDWIGDEEIFVGDEELFGDGPARALIVRYASQPTAVLVGEEGWELLRLDLKDPAFVRIAELPRFSNDVGGMCRLEVLALSRLSLIHWELGVLALDPSFELRWRHDLEWNHRLINLDDEEIWFDLMYESDDLPQQIGDQPWGYSAIDGRELFDRNPPAQQK